MAPPVRAEVALTSLQNCLVNLPPGLIALISNTNIVCDPLLDQHLVLTPFSQLKMWSSSCSIDLRPFRQGPSQAVILLAFNDQHMLAGLECPVGLGRHHF